MEVNPMKKFSLLVAICLIVGLLAGCAGTPVIYYSECTCPPAAHEETPATEAPAETEAPKKATRKRTAKKASE